MIKAFIFDMDGVIIDSEPIHSVSDQMVLREFGIEITEHDLNCYIGMTNPVIWADLKEKHNLGASVEELLEKQFSYKMILFGNDKLKPINGILELLEDLKSKDIAIGLASSSARRFIDLVLKNLHINHYFDVIVSGEELKNSKPAPDIFLKAADLLKVDPKDCIVLEDSANGVKAAKSAGMRCIAFNNPNSGNQDLSPADLIVDSIENLNYSAVQY